MKLYGDLEGIHKDPVNFESGLKVLRWVLMDPSTVVPLNGCVPVDPSVTLLLTTVFIPVPVVLTPTRGSLLPVLSRL